MSGTAAARVRYVPLERRRRHGAEYAARRAMFLQSYRFSSDGRREEGLFGRLARRMRAGLARAWRGWRPRADLTLLGCFGPGHHRRHKYYLHDYA